MKLPTPETWETQVALKGNKASTWEQLLGKKINYKNFLFFKKWLKATSTSLLVPHSGENSLGNVMEASLHFSFS